MAIITVDSVNKSFGGIHAVNDASIQVEAGSITGVIGPNGSGKTTLFNMISGVFPPESGTVTLNGTNITNKPPHAINRLGLGRMFQITRLFGQMTVLENLLVAGHTHGMDRARELLQFVGLEHLAHEYTANLSYGQSKLIEFIRVLMTNPQVIMLDEPFAGVNPLMEARMVTYLRALAAEGKTILLTDHEMHIIMSLCNTLYVMEFGFVIAHGTPAEIRENEQVIEAYFGR